MSSALAGNLRLPTVGRRSLPADGVCGSLPSDGKPFSDAFQLGHARRRVTTVVQIPGPPLHPDSIHPCLHNGSSAIHDLRCRQTADPGYDLAYRVQALISVTVHAAMKPVKVLTIDTRRGGSANERHTSRKGRQGCKRPNALNHGSGGYPVDPSKGISPLCAPQLLHPCTRRSGQAEQVPTVGPHVVPVGVVDDGPPVRWSSS